MVTELYLLQWMGAILTPNANPASPVGGADLARIFLYFNASAWQCFGMAMLIDFAPRNFGWEPMDAEFSVSVFVGLRGLML
ncbi:MAG: hypothetical protein NC095_10060 [Muribaculum sp.]|nr:hypothetical protein [Muribaculum sp.]